MAIFGSHTLLGKAGKWLKKSTVGKIVGGIATVGGIALGGGAVVGVLKGAGKLVKMAGAAVRDKNIKEDEIVKTLQDNNLPVTKEGILEVKRAIEAEAGIPLLVTKTTHDVPSGGIMAWVKAHLGIVLGVVGGIVVLVMIAVYKPFGKKVGRKK